MAATSNTGPQIANSRNQPMLLGLEMTIHCAGAGGSRALFARNVTRDDKTTSSILAIHGGTIDAAEEGLISCLIFGVIYYTKRRRSLLYTCNRDGLNKIGRTSCRERV